MMASVSRTCPLSTLLQGLSIVDASDDVIITSLSLDSRAVQKDGLFFSLARSVEQRTNNLKQALECGSKVVLSDASVVLSSEELALFESHQALVYYVADLANQTSEISARFYDYPSRDMTVIAVTGTNGKTSVSQFIAQALESLQKTCGVIGTLGVGTAGVYVSNQMTTPDPVTIQSVLADFRQQGIEHVVLEASSHALDQARLKSVDIDVAIFTHLTRDHLDYHGDMQSYAAAKQRLFEMPCVKSVVLNITDDFGRSLIELMAEKQSVEVLTYSTEQTYSATVLANEIETSLSGIRFNLVNSDNQQSINSELLAPFNVDNLIAAFAGLRAIGVSFSDAAEAIEKCHAVEGRMQTYSKAGRPLVVVDFAHTSGALSDALQSLRSHLSDDGDLWCVFGCGGDRDQGKRPIMGQVVEKLAEHCVVTSDNPRSELNVDIVNDILLGMSQPECVHVEHDRELAIEYAISHANSSDIVLVAGKGHEQYQEVSGVKLPFSDVEVVKQQLALSCESAETEVMS